MPVEDIVVRIVIPNQYISIIILRDIVAISNYISIFINDKSSYGLLVFTYI